MSNRINPRDFDFSKTRKISNERLDDSKKPITKVYYLNELVPSVKIRREVKDLGILEPPWPPAIGMDKMHTRSKSLRYIIDFAHQSSIHGLNHLVAPRRHAFERLLYGSIMVGSVIGLILISLNSWHRYRNESTSLVLDNNFRKFSISKPSVTICPYDLLDDKKFPEVFRRHNISDTASNREFMNSLSKLNYSNIAGESILAEVADREEASVPASYAWLELLHELRGQVKIWNEYDHEFVWTITERGLCMLYASNVAPYFDVESWIKRDTAPKDRSIAKRETLNVDNSGVIRSISCKSHNFWIGFHHPDSVIDYTTPGKSVQMLKLNSLTLKISEVSTSSSVEMLSVQQRNCKLPEDAGLSMWPVYSSVMCKLECRYDVIRKLCGCLPHFAKPIEGVSTCNVRQLFCIADHNNEILSLTKLKECGCIEDCNEALYIDKEYTSFLLKEGSPADAVMNLNIDFPQVKYVHEELFSFTDLLASIGGAAGLFLGASVLSVFEIVYFLTLRLVLYVFVKKENKKKLAP